jgi:hypothetical protein
VTYALHMQPGDWFAGMIDPAAPTTPTQVWAAAHKLASVTPYTDDNGRRMLALTAEGFNLTPIPAAVQVLLIRGMP